MPVCYHDSQKRPNLLKIVIFKAEVGARSNMLCRRTSPLPRVGCRASRARAWPPSRESPWPGRRCSSSFIRRWTRWGTGWSSSGGGQMEKWTNGHGQLDVENWTKNQLVIWILDNWTSGQKQFFLKGNDDSLDSKAQRSSEQTNYLSFCPRSCCSNLKQP